MISDDLQYLQQEAFHFSLEVNPHAQYCNTIREELFEHTMLPDREEAYRTGHFIEARVYPNGSVTFFITRGTRIEDVIREQADICRQQKCPQTAISRAFDPCEVPAPD